MGNFNGSESRIRVFIAFWTKSLKDLFALGLAHLSEIQFVVIAEKICPLSGLGDRGGL